MKGNYEKDIGGFEMEETCAVDLARPAPPPQGRRAADSNPQGGLPPPARLRDLCGLMQGLEDLRMEETFD